MARNQREAVGGFIEVFGLGLGAAAYCGVGAGFRAGTASESIRGAARKDRTPCLSLGAGDLGATKNIVNHFKDRAGLKQSYGKQLIANIQWRQECAIRVGLGSKLPVKTQMPLVDKSGQVFAIAESDVVSYKSM
jgi:hypothetical protein